MNTTPTDHKIEFMAYFVDEQKLYDWETIVSAKGSNTLLWIDNQNVVYDGKDKNGYVVHNYLMQLTALRSINDEPIYNHMIVKNELGSLYIVDMFNYTIMFILSNEKLQIVGNRFQHSELLELCK